MVVKAHNRDLAIRRQVLGWSQQDVADRLCGFNPDDPEQRGKGFHFSAVSRFETGENELMPAPTRGERRLRREDYERLLKRHEPKQRAP